MCETYGLNYTLTAGNVALLKTLVVVCMILYFIWILALIIDEIRYQKNLEKRRARRYENSNIKRATSKASKKN